MISNSTFAVVTISAVGTAQACNTKVSQLLARNQNGLRALSSPTPRRMLLEADEVITKPSLDIDEILSNLPNEWSSFYGLPDGWVEQATMSQRMRAIPKQVDEEGNFVRLDWDRNIVRLTEDGNIVHLDAEGKIVHLEEGGDLEDATACYAYKNLDEAEFHDLLQNFQLDEELLGIDFLMDPQWNDGLLKSLGDTYATKEDFIQSFNGIASANEIAAIENNLEHITFGVNSNQSISDVIDNPEVPMLGDANSVLPPEDAEIRELMQSSINNGQDPPAPDLSPTINEGATPPPPDLSGTGGTFPDGLADTGVEELNGWLKFCSGVGDELLFGIGIPLVFLIVIYLNWDSIAARLLKCCLKNVMED